MRRGPERALVDVYIPTLLLLPVSYHWTIIGHLSFNQTAIIPIAGFLIARSWQDWEWSATDLVVTAYVVMSVVSEYFNKDFYEARNAALQAICDSVLPYVVAKSIPVGEELYAEISKRIVVCLTIVSIVSVHEFRMGRNLFDLFLKPFFPGQEPSAQWIARYGFLRPAGPYGHAIVAGIIFAIGLRLIQWLRWGDYWPGSVPLLPVSKVRFCQLWLVAGLLMTLSRGPWLGAAVGALVVWVGRARNRKRAIVITALVILLAGIPAVQAFKSYVWVQRDEAVSMMEESAAYRHELIEKYITIVQEHPMWGWGRHNFPTVDSMSSIDNHYLLVALTYGEPVLALFVLLLLWIMIRLVLFCRLRHGLIFPGSIALTFLGIYVLITISIGTVWLGAQTVQLLFLISGWSEALILAPVVMSHTQEEPIAASHAFKFRRVLI
jgi:hypothetical protein